MGRKVAVKGSSGSGTSTFAVALARRLNLLHVELDALNHGSNWTEATDEELRERVQAAIDANPGGWVMDGNYERKLGSMVTDAADTVVWLDFALGLILNQLRRRTAHRIRNKVELWNGNRETWATALAGWDPLFVWAIRSHLRHRREWPARFASHPGFVRLRTPGEASRWPERL